MELTEEEANTYFEQLNANGAVADDAYVRCIKCGWTILPRVDNKLLEKL